MSTTPSLDHKIIQLVGFLPQCIYFNETELQRRFGEMKIVNHLFVFDKLVLAIKGKLLENTNTIVGKFRHDVNKIHKEIEKSMTGVCFTTSLSVVQQVGSQSDQNETPTFLTTTKVFCGQNENEIINELCTFLHSKQIFLYDNDGSAVMLPLE